MRGNPNPRAASVHPFHRSGAITDIPRREGREANERQLGPTDDGEQWSAPEDRAFEPEPAPELASFLWRRPEPGLDPAPSYAQKRATAEERPTAEDSGIWRDHLLAEIEDLAEKLKEKVARYSLLRAAQFSDQAGELANEMAVKWIQEALEDIAATALGIEIASRELFLKAASVGEPDRTSGTAQEQTTAGTAE
jgi:hypothetical protein